MNLNEKIKIEELSADFNYSFKTTAVILSAGHGKRIKSNKSKMLHEIWGKPTVKRVYEACVKGLNNFNSITVVGVKALEVMEVFGRQSKNSFVLQSEQKGTGHAVQVALDIIDEKKYDGTILVLPGDMGLIDAETVKNFVYSFEKSNADMMVLTGLYEGKLGDNSYGRILRVKQTDSEGNSSGNDYRKVIGILENKDILAMDDDENYSSTFKSRKYIFSKKELLNNNEFNSGVFAFNFRHLKKLIFQIKSNNAQGEIYLTDMISLFNKNGLAVAAVSPAEQHVIMGFNDKTVLRQMNDIARKLAFEKLKNIIEIEDPRDFFIDETVIENILEGDSNGILWDIFIGKGVHIGGGVKINPSLCLKRGVNISGNVTIDNNVTIMENVSISCFDNQKIKIGSGTKILSGNIIKGNVSVGNNCTIEPDNILSGTDVNSLKLGNNVVVKGRCNIFGSVIGDNIFLENSVLVKKLIKNDNNGKILKIINVRPNPVGENFLSDIK